MEFVRSVLPVLIGVALAATVAVLFAGIVGMGRDSAFNRRYGNHLMRWRVALQGLTVALFALYLVLLAAGG
jgi:biopolymer transport protein ExbB/TolQ